MIDAELARVAAEGVSEAELNLAREHIKGSLTLSLESTSSRMIRLGRGEFTHGYHLTTEEIEAKIDAVGEEEVASLARELFAPENLGLCVLGPIDEGAVNWRRNAAVA